MTTESLSKILNRDLAEADAKQLIDLVSPILKEVINYSTWAYSRCLSTGDKAYEDLPASCTLSPHD